MTDMLIGSLLGIAAMLALFGPFLWWAVKPVTADIGDAPAPEPQCACGWYQLQNYEQVVIDSVRGHSYTACRCTPR